MDVDFAGLSGLGDYAVQGDDNTATTYTSTGNKKEITIDSFSVPQTYQDKVKGEPMSLFHD